MGKKLIALFVCIIVVIANAYYFTNYYETKIEAVTAAIKVNKTNLKQENYQLVKIPNSSYFICITDIPHSMYVYKTSSMFHKYKATLYNVEHLYAGDGAGIHYVIGKLAYGFTKEKPKDKDIYIGHKKMNVLELGKYFKNSKYELIYRNLVLYYPDQPMTTKNSSNFKMGFDEITYR